MTSFTPVVSRHTRHDIYTSCCSLAILYVARARPSSAQLSSCLGLVIDLTTTPFDT